MVPEIEIKVSESRALTEIGSIGFQFRDKEYSYLFIYLFIYFPDWKLRNQTNNFPGVMQNNSAIHSYASLLFQNKGKLIF